MPFQRMSRVLAVLCFAVSAFFVFYTVRLLVVTGGLVHTRAGGHGAGDAPGHV